MSRKSSVAVVKSSAPSFPPRKASARGRVTRTFVTHECSRRHRKQDAALLVVAATATKVAANIVIEVAVVG